MTIITISRGAFSEGEAVAQATAKRLGYDCVSRDVLLAASDEWNIPEIKLARAMHDAPSALERIRHNKQGYMAYIRSAFVARMSEDDVVYHGLAGHLLVRGVDHVFKVRIIADLEDRVAREMMQENLSPEEARARIGRDDEARRKWTHVLYGVDPCDPCLYDLVVHIHRFTVEDAVELIRLSVERKRFETTPASRQTMADLALACRIKAELVEPFPDVAVACAYGNVLVYTHKGDRLVRKLESRLKTVARALDGVHSVEVHSGVPFPADAV